MEDGGSHRGRLVAGEGKDKCGWTTLMTTTHGPITLEWLEVASIFSSFISTSKKAV
jgi:hypothetical protein